MRDLEGEIRRPRQEPALYEMLWICCDCLGESGLCDACREWRIERLLDQIAFARG